MKLFRLITCVVVLCSMATLNSCQKDDMSSYRSAALISNKGNLAFHVVDGSRREVQGATVAIARNEFDLHHGTYIAVRVTDIKGRADFGLLTKGEYFYKAEGTVDGIRYYREGSVQVQTDKDLIRDVILK